MFTGIPPTKDGRPVTLTAYVQWTGDIYGDIFRIIETLQLRRTPADNGWYGESAAIGKHVTIKVFDAPVLERVHIEIKLFDDGAYYANHLWPGIGTRFRKPWGTDLLREIDPPAKALIELQILA